MSEPLTDQDIADLRESAREHLRLTMRELSEDFFAAGWMCDLEYYLWTAINDPHKRRGYFGGLEQSTRASILRVANLAGGWWSWGKDSKREVFVPMDEWIRRYDLRQAVTGS